MTGFICLAVSIIIISLASSLTIGESNTDNLVIDDLPFEINGVDSCTLNLGVCTINNAKVTSQSVISCMSQSGITNLGSYHVSARVSGSNYTIISTNVLETTSLGCVLIEP